MFLYSQWTKRRLGQIIKEDKRIYKKKSYEIEKHTMKIYVRNIFENMYITIISIVIVHWNPFSHSYVCVYVFAIKFSTISYKNRKIIVSFLSEHCASFYRFFCAHFERGGVCISLTRKSLIFLMVTLTTREIF